MNFSPAYLLLIVVFGVMPVVGAGDPPTLATKAKQAYVIDCTSGAVLLRKNADQQMTPSSMTKMMTAYITLTRIKQHDIAETDLFHVSERAYKMGGSRMFLEIGASVTVADLLMGTVVVSGNDSSVALAEGISGTEEDFSGEMNQMAGRIGMQNTNFVNASGWPHKSHYSTAEDLAILAKRTITDFPQQYKKYYLPQKFTHNTITQANRLPLLGREGFGVDGLKTGSSDDGGHGVTLSAAKNGRRIIVVLNGLKDKKSRFEEAQSVVTWAFSQFRTLKVADARAPLGNFDVWLGAQSQVAVATDKDVFYTLARRDIPDLKAEIRVKAPIPAPIKKGMEVGKLVVTGSSTMDAVSVPVYATADVPAIGFVGKITHAIRYLLFGHSE